MNNRETYSIQSIAAIVQAACSSEKDFPILFLQTDSRRIIAPAETLFFALPGNRRSGEDYIPELIQRGVIAFVVSAQFSVPNDSPAVFVKVPDVLKALQQLAAYHRSLFSLPVIGITGSNGKTIVKEWLYQLMQDDEVIVRSPRSYNSQIGVPLSVWQIKPQHTLGIFEAGISTVDEMQQLHQIIQPTIGVFTNLSDAHSEGFSDRKQKLIEKLKLFSGVQTLVYALDEVGMPLLSENGLATKGLSANAVFSWSRHQPATLQVTDEKIIAHQTQITAVYKSESCSLLIPFTDRISVNNALICWLTLVAMGYNTAVASERLSRLEPIDMRMQLIKGINQCTLINDSYSNDLTSLSLAIDYQVQQAGDLAPLLIVSDLPAPEASDEIVYPRLAQLLQAKEIRQVIGIGPRIARHADAFHAVHIPASFFIDTESFLRSFRERDFQSCIILLKGARLFQFERIVRRLELKTHQTQLTINLTALSRNVKKHQSLLLPNTKMMVVLKAFGYGTGSAEIAKMLQYQQVQYLAVAYIDEGIELRKAGIRLPIMVMNAEESGFEALLQYQLEPELYSFAITRSFLQFLGKEGITHFPVHLKINTGMNRLGFNPDEIPELVALLQQNPLLRVQTVFSHFVASENPAADAFTRNQLAVFTAACATLAASLPYSFLRHIANSAAIHRHPQAQLDMVRLGMGMYGGDQSGALALEPVATLTTTVAQVRKVPKGQTVGYGLEAEMEQDTIIAVVNIGYADGYPRALGQGIGEMWLAGKPVPVVGHVCMDMTMLDVTHIPEVVAGAEVEVMGVHMPVAELAAKAGTIPYEIMTGISSRVKRVYLEE
ncbi:MAG: bifunctional UDP-N-acetylmuramoyl-tripeptide:D-alanyl-D-alanine ligase/alanine racemase [Bacteroidetes bacterium]|nr:bifunctional UDP-N-acetylmuramoyl-tripeptide:D-alanyl-D-alanine ligase/alanine racemase [Bacteroidota bacterium]